MILDPAPKALVNVVRFFRKNQYGQPVVPAPRLLGFIQTDPWIGLPILRQRDHTEGLGDVVSATDYVANLLGKLGLVRAVGEQLVVASTSHQLGARVLLLLKDQPGAVLVDVEAVLDDGRQLYLERVVVDSLVARDVNLQRCRFGTSQVADSNGS